PLLRRACASVDLLTVRDTGSKARLEAAGVDRDIQVVPDTAVLIDDVLTAPDRAAAAERLRVAGVLPPPGTPFVAVHASFSAPGTLAELAGALEEVRSRHPQLEVVLVEIGPTHGDAATLRSLARQLTRTVRTAADPTLLEVAAILEAAEVVVASSFHAMLVASALGTRTVGFLQSSHRPAKLVDLSRALDREAWLVDRPSMVATALEAALAGEGPADPDLVARMARASRAHLDHLTDVLLRAEPRTVDLDERTAAHGHLVDRLAVAAAREQRLREDLQVVDTHLRGARSAARTWEAAFWRLEARTADAGDDRPVLDVGAIEATELEEEPYRWGLVGPVFAPEAAAGLARTFPLDEAEERQGTDGRRSWSYRVRCLLPMDRSTPVRPHALDPLWRQLADDLAGPAYRRALSRATGVDVAPLHLEANLFSYGPGAFQEPHLDLPEKVVTHLLWVNEDGEAEYGGCLRILRSRDPEDLHRELLPTLGWSALLVRSPESWHSVTPVTAAAPMDRRALVATFHRPGSVSTMWGEAPD
ncbi:MAG TPA: polysaccharide pyruvyl transferase family protein, partial [Acidimicrobiales bacterium]|nr:polysaccharide pyruvyl transferase family protein [Acidimicrobiales bacterium]